jgi:uncharacterized protein YndB with AHSA1/START domain
MEDIKKELTLERTYDAPIELVWKMWTDPKLVAQWWGPRGVTNTTNSWEARPGGKIDLVMLAGEELGPMAGQKWPMTGEFKVVEQPAKLVFTGNAILNGKEVLQHLATVTFEEAGDKTKMTVHIVVTKATPEAAGPLSGMEMGWNMQLDKLGEFLKGTRV